MLFPDVLLVTQLGIPTCLATFQHLLKMLGKVIMGASTLIGVFPNTIESVLL